MKMEKSFPLFFKISFLLYTQRLDTEWVFKSLSSEKKV